LKTAVTGNRIIVLIVIVIAAATLRAGGGGSGSSGCLICGERGLADFLSNIILFAPLGAAIALRRIKFWHALVIGGLLSLSIEIAQWRLIPGRDSNLGDLVANTIGTLLGWTFVRTRSWRPLDRGATLRAYGFALFTLLFLLGALRLLAPEFSRSVYYLHWTPSYESLTRYSGTVLLTRLGPMEWLQGPHARMEHPDSVAKLLSGAPLQTRFIAGEAPASLAPIISISDEVMDEVVLVGVDGTDLVYRFRSKADDLRLEDANLRVPDVFHGLAPGDTALLSISFDTEGYCITLNAGTVCGRGYSVGDIWSMLVDPHWRPVAYRAFGAFFLWLAFLPTGLVMPTKRTLLITAGAVALVLAVGPRLLEFSSTPWYQIAAAILGLFAGRAIGTRLAPLHR
jgi:hypothetical protein